MKHLLTIVTMLLAFGVAQAQSNKVTSAWNYMQHEEFEQAAQAINAAIEHEKTKEDGKTWFYRTQIYTGIMRDETLAQKYPNAAEEAYRSYQNVLKYDEKNRYSRDVKQYVPMIVPQLFNAGAVAYSNKEFAKAAEGFERYLEVLEKEMPNQTDTAAIFYTAQSYFVVKDMENAERHLETLMEYQYEEPWVYKALYQINIDDADTTAALQALQVGQEVFPDDKDLSNLEVNIYMQQGKTDILTQKLLKALKNDPENATIYTALANVYDQTGKQDSAIFYNKKALALDPNFFDANYNLGIIYYNKAADLVNEALDITDVSKYNKLKAEYEKIFRQALPYLEKAHEIQPDDRNTMISLSEIYVRLGETEKAEAIRAEMKRE